MILSSVVIYYEYVDTQCITSAPFTKFLHLLTLADYDTQVLLPDMFQVNHRHVQHLERNG